MSKQLCSLKKKGGGTSGLIITDTFDTNRYNPETVAQARTILRYDATNCKSFVFNLTTFTSTAGSPTISVMGDSTTLYSIAKGQTGSYTINNPSQYSEIDITITSVLNANNVKAIGNVVRTY